LNVREPRRWKDKEVTTIKAVEEAERDIEKLLDIVAYWESNWGLSVTLRC
jgi:translation initiation factor 1 (eIF-1/SUI1)